MSPSTITLLFLAFAVVMFVWEKIPLALTAMIVSVGLTITGVLDAKTAFAGFVNSNVILCVAMFIVGQALFETGMANKIGSLVTRFAKTERQCIIAVMVITGTMSGFLSNTGTAAVLIPVVIGIAASSGFSRGKLLMPLVFAAALGGNLSIIGAGDAPECFALLHDGDVPECPALPDGGAAPGRFVRGVGKRDSVRLSADGAFRRFPGYTVLYP